MSSRDNSVHFRHFFLGLAFIAVVVLLLGTSVAIYNKEFSRAVPVVLHTNHVGNQMAEGADVKVRGVRIGEVREIRSTDSGAALQLAIEPEKAASIPANVSARLLPKTLFGQRYVSLDLPKQRDTENLAEGSVISQDRSRNAIETERVLNNLMPVLQAVQPQKLSSMLTEVSTALEGRGKSLGETLVELNRFLQRFNPSLPDLNANIQKLPGVTDTYSEAAPQFLQALRQATTTSQTIAAQRQKLRHMYQSVITGSDNLARFTDANKDNFINLTASSRGALEVLAKYAPEYPCLLRQLRELIPLVDKGFGKGTDKPHMLHAQAEISTSRGKYVPGRDTPVHEDKRGPRCYPKAPYPQKFPQYPAEGPLRDGSHKPAAADVGEPQDQGAGNALSHVLPSADSSSRSTTPQSASVKPVANSQEERNLVSLLMAPELGVMPSDVPDWSGLLVAPLYRGSEVTVR